MKEEKTNFQLIKELDSTFAPKNFGILSAEEVKTVKNTLQLDEFEKILDLRNLRDFVVLYFSKKVQDNKEETYRNLDKCSAVTAVIDQRIVELGGEV